MIQSSKKMFGLSLIICMVLVLPLMSTVTAAEKQQDTIKMLQPQALNHTGIHDLKKIDPNLTGSDVKFTVVCRSITYIDGEPQNDYRPSTEHNCFSSDLFTFKDQPGLPPGISPHSTAICSILFGDDPNAFNQYLGNFHYQGAAPRAKADIYEFWHFLTNNVFPQSPPDTDVLTASIGNQFSDWWTRGIEALAENYGLVVVAGVGNGYDAYDPPLYPAAAANVIGVGIVNSVNTENLATSLKHFSLAYPENSSSGPTPDGRCKPDIVAPGNCLAANANEPTQYEPTGNWSSFSTPLTAGAIGLLIQKAKQDPNLNTAVSPKGGNCVIKAIIMNSATKLPYWHKGRLDKYDDHSAPLDYIQGAGMLNALKAYENLIAGGQKPGDVSKTGWDLNLLQKNEILENAYRFTIAEPNEKLITATTVWNRHYNKIYPFEPIHDKNTNLRLEIWAIDPNDPNNDYLLDYSDSSVDNVEHIYCKADANYTYYEINVSYSDTNDPNRIPGDQRYGLAWNVSDVPETDNISWYDLYADGIVDKLDVAAWAKNFIAAQNTPERYILGDINNDGAIDINDLTILTGHKGLKAPWYKDNSTK